MFQSLSEVLIQKKRETIEEGVKIRRLPDKILLPNFCKNTVEIETVRLKAGREVARALLPFAHLRLF
jgi:hypothetical protein